MVTKLIFFDELFLDVSPIFCFWAAKYLIRNCQTVRKWVIGVSCTLILMSLSLVLFSAVVGTEDVTIGVFGSEIAAPKLWHLIIVMSVVIIIFGIPI